jgi:type IV secretory pathway VirB10-like protein
MADHSATPTTPVTDHRPVPRGVLPRNVQTWLMAALAAGMLLIIVLTGQPNAPATARPPVPSAGATNPDRVREYQDRLRMLETRAVEEAQLPPPMEPPLPPSFDDDIGSSRPVDPLAADRQRREYESLFASNVALSRRTDGPRAAAATDEGLHATALPAGRELSVDDIADAVVRASTRQGVGLAGTVARATETSATPAERPVAPPEARVDTLTGLPSPHRVLEGTFIDTVLTTRLDGGMAAPVSCLVTNPVYALSGRDVLIPAGSRILGETRPVQTLGETRLAVLFHRLILPDGRSVALDQFKGLNQIGDAGLRDRVNHHYWSTFGAASAVGLVNGLSQLLGSAGFGLGDGNRTVVVAGNASDGTAQATAQVMNRFLNRLPTITIREGHRVKVYVTSDLALPVWSSPDHAQAFLRR